MDKTFDELMAEVKKGESFGGRKLTFPEKCGVFAALYGGAKNQIVARAFDLSVQTVSKLSGCLSYDPEPYRYEIDPKTDTISGAKVMMDHNRNRTPGRVLHYNDVAREFEALGKEEFTKRYYTERIHNRILLAKVALRDERRGRK